MTPQAYKLEEQARKKEHSQKDLKSDKNTPYVGEDLEPLPLPGTATTMPQGTPRAGAPHFPYRQMHGVSAYPVPYKSFSRDTPKASREKLWEDYKIDFFAFFVGVFVPLRKILNFQG